MKMCLIYRKFWILTIFQASLFVTALFSGVIPKGTWYCIEAAYRDTVIEGFTATFTIVDGENYKADFYLRYQHGWTEALYQYSTTGDTFFTWMPKEIKLSGGAGYYGTKRYYNYMLDCSQSLWDRAGAVALGWGFPPGATKSRILFSVLGDSLLILKSWDQKSVLTYTFGALRPPHNPVIFGVNMRIQRQLGNFNPNQGDRVVVRGDFNGWSSAGLAMEETGVPDVYQVTLDLAGGHVGKTFAYKFVILKSSGEIVESDPNRTFTLQPHGQNLGVAYFDRRGRVDEVTAISVANAGTMEIEPATAYDPERNRFLVTWTTESNDIYGRFVRGDGTPQGNAFPIARGTHEEKYSQVEFNTRQFEWLVVWQDNRRGNWDIFGVRLDVNGKKKVSPNAEPDSSFAICQNDSDQVGPRLAFNDLENTYLVVWTDGRNLMKKSWGGLVNYDVFGRRVSGSGALLDSEDLPICAKEYYDELKPDVAYCGTAGKKLNEWLVVFVRSEVDYYISRIWGVRIHGKTGKRLNTWGQEVTESLAKSMGKLVPPFLPEFPIGWDGESIWGVNSYTFQGSPHVESNDDAPRIGMGKSTAERYPIPEFLVTWTESRSSETISGSTLEEDIYCQRVAYFPDSTAFRLGFKTERGPDSLFTAVLLDQEGNWPENPMHWITWPNFLVTPDPFAQDWNNVSYCANDGSFLVVWNDWRNVLWNGEWPGDGTPIPPADIYGQRAYLNPKDSSLTWIEHDGLWTPTPLNTPITFTDPDEGHFYYPAVAFGTYANTYLVAYEYLGSEAGENVDIVANLYQGALPASTGVEENPMGRPHDFILCQNYPNPFNPTTTVRYALPKAQHVVLKLYNILGQEVMTLVDKKQEPGYHTVEINASHLPSGLYFYVLQTSEFRAVRKIMLIK